MLSPLPFLFFPSADMGENGTSVSSLSEGDGDSTENDDEGGVGGTTISGGG